MEKLKMALKLSSFVEKNYKDDVSVSLLSNLVETEDFFIDTGNYLLNAQVSGDMYKGFQGLCIHQIAGVEQSGKTLILTQIAQRLLQSETDDWYVIWIDTENAFNRKLFQSYGDRFVYIGKNIIEDLEPDVLKFLDFFRESKVSGEKFKMMVVIDSWGGLDIRSMLEKGKQGKTSLDPGQRAIFKNNFVKKFVSSLPSTNTTVFITNHVYESPDLYSGKKISGGSGLKYFSQGITTLSPVKATDESGKENMKQSQKNIMCEQLKGRYPVKPFTKIMVPIYFDRGGLTRLGGMFEFCKDNNIIAHKSKGNYYFTFEDPNETSNLFTINEMKSNYDEIFTEARLNSINELLVKIFTFQNSSEIDLVGE
jgi:RecA/RadA recombinase